MVLSFGEMENAVNNEGERISVSGFWGEETMDPFRKNGLVNVACNATAKRCS